MVLEKEKIIAVIDDDEDIVEMTKVMLESTGYKVRSFTNPLEVEEELTEKPDLILADLCMPGMDGISLARQIREKYNPDIPVVIMTALPHDPELRDCVNRGQVVCLTKPFGIDDVLRSVGHALRESLSK